ncbi:MAG TPA: hypothetical protein GXZ67_03340 [Clostridiaceae bacterium]|nr:hypothetical protein [Clostridiaceae bacterium]
MKYCNKCQLEIRDDSIVCPLCKAVTEDLDGVKYESFYPDANIDYKKFHFLKRIFLFLSVVAVMTSVVLNVIFYTGFLWSLITIAAIIYLWIGISHSLGHHINIASKILAQSVLGSLFIVLIDFLVGYLGWSVSFVIPSIFILADLAVVILILVNRMDFRNYLLYQFAIALLGLFPMILFLITRIGHPAMVIISAAVSLLTLIGTTILGDKTVKTEIKKRFHF